MSTWSGSIYNWQWVHLAKTEQNWCNFLLVGCCLFKTDCTITDTGLAVDTAEHLIHATMKLYMLVLKKANGYATSLDGWANYNFLYIEMKILNNQSPQIIKHISAWHWSQQNKKINIKNWF